MLAAAPLDLKEAKSCPQKTGVRTIVAIAFPPETRGAAANLACLLVCHEENFVASACKMRGNNQRL
jgi:hypothetical protein